MTTVQAIGTFAITASSTAAISPSLVWNDGGSHTPQVLLLFCRRGTSTHSGSQNLSMGMTDGTTHFSQAWVMDDAVATSETAQYRTDNGPLCEVGVGTVVSGLLDFTSFGTDTFTLTPSDAFTFSAEGFYIALSGYDNAKVMVHQLDADVGPCVRTGAGFQATAAVFMSPLISTTIDAGSVAGCMCFGWATDSTHQAVVALRATDAVTTNYTWGQMRTDSVLLRASNSGGTADSQASLTSFNPDGYTLNQDVGNVAHYYGVLLLKGGVILATTCTAQGSSGPFNIAAPGIFPSLVLGMAEWSATTSQTNSSEGFNVGIGALTTNQQWTITQHSSNRETLSGGQLTEEYSRAVTDKFLIHYSRTGADTFTAVGEIEKSSLSPQQVTLNQSDDDSTPVLIPLLIFGESYGAFDGQYVPRAVNFPSLPVIGQIVPQYTWIT